MIFAFVISFIVDEFRGGYVLKFLLNDKVMVGTFMKIPHPDVVHLLALAGFDFIVCDMEHSQTTETDIRALTAASKISNIPLIVRYPDPNQGTLNRLLEMGVCGIQIPRVSSIKAVSSYYDMMYYPPLGKRSFGNATLEAKYGDVPIKTHLESQNNSNILVAQFENKDIEGSLDDYMKYLDVAFLGPVDLSIDLGKPGDFSSEEFKNAVLAIETAAKNSGTVLGVFAGTVEQAKEFISKGYKYIALSGDITLLKQASKSLVTQIKANLT